MKHFLATCGTFLMLSLGILGAYAVDDSKNKTADKRTQDNLPAQPPKAGTDTVKGSGLKPYDGHKQAPKFKEVPPPPKDKDKDKKK